MKIDFNKNVVYFPKVYSEVVRQQGRPAVDPDFDETQNVAANADLKPTARTDRAAVFEFGERVLLAQLQKAELNSRKTPSFGLGIAPGVSGPVEPQFEAGLTDSREDARSHKERLGNLLAKLHGESALPNRKEILTEIRRALADLSGAVGKNVSLLTKVKDRREELCSGADSLLEKRIADLETEIEENQKQLRNSRECVDTAQA